MFYKTITNVFLILNIFRAIAEKLSVSLCNNYQLNPASDVSRSNNLKVIKF